MEAYLEKRYTHQQSLAENLANLALTSDPADGILQVSWILLRQMWNSADTHLHRAIDFRHQQPTLQRKARHIAEITSRLMALDPLTESQIQLLYLDARHGGLGVNAPLVTAAIAQVTAELQHRNLNQPYDDDWTGGFRASKWALEAIGLDLPVLFDKDERALQTEGAAQPSPVLHAGLVATQKQRLKDHWGWTDPLRALDDADLYDPRAAKIARAAHAALLEQIPTAELNVSDWTMQICMRMTLGQDLTWVVQQCNHIPHKALRPCGEPLSSDVHQAWHCCRGPIMKRHNRLAFRWQQLAKEAGWTAYCEQDVITRMDPVTYKRADIVTTATDGTRYILDVQTMGSMRPSAQEIRTAEAAKHKEYHTDSSCWRASTFVPLVHAAFGPMGPRAAASGGHAGQPARNSILGQVSTHGQGPLSSALGGHCMGQHLQSPAVCLELGWQKAATTTTTARPCGNMIGMNV